MAEMRHSKLISVGAMLKAATLVALSLFAASSMASAPSTTGSATSSSPVPSSQTYSGDSPEAQAIHRRLLQTQLNQQQFQKQQDFKAAMSERSKMQAAVTEIDEKKAHSITLSATEKSALDGQRAQLIKQIKLLDQYLKESSLNKK